MAIKRLTAGNDVFADDALGNTILGLAGADVINGGAGNDKIFGGAGNDSLNGGTGDDFIDGGTGADSINGGAGTHDRVSYASVTGTHVTSTLGQTGVQINLSGSSAFGIAARTSFAGTAKERDVLKGVEDVQGSKFADIIAGDNFANTLFGLAGNDILSGLGGSDQLFGGLGNDTLFGGEGNDTMFGGAGADTMFGSNGSDIFKFAAGDSRFNNVNAGDFDDFVLDYDDAFDRFDLSAIAGVDSLADISVMNFTHATHGAGAFIRLGNSSSLDFVFVDGYSTAQVSLSDFIF